MEFVHAVIALGLEAQQIFYQFEDDSTGEPSIFFPVVLSDEAIPKDKQ